MDVPNSTGESSIAIANNSTSTGTSTYSYIFRNWDEMMKSIKKEEQLNKERRESEKQEKEGESEKDGEMESQKAEKWLCKHYNRSCRVRFPCCTQFYPCHRCHNSASNCKNDEAIEWHATHLKCSLCQFEQEVSFRFPWLRVHVTVGSLRNDHGNGGDSASIESYDWLNQEK